jgi:hypothetical protein
MGGDVMATGKLCFKSFTFFMLQPIGITVELVVSYLWCLPENSEGNPKTSTADTKHIEQSPAKHHNDNFAINTRKPLAEEPIPPLWIRCVGSIWVALWMLWTAAYMVDALYSARLSANSGQL